MHPYAQKEYGYDISKEIEVEVEGEVKNGVPHGMSYLYFHYKGELEYNFEAPSRLRSSFSNGHPFTVSGTGVLVDGKLSGGPALFL